jgi:hypothetical protein
MTRLCFISKSEKKYSASAKKIPKNRLLTRRQVSINSLSSLGSAEFSVTISRNIGCGKKIPKINPDPVK